MSLLCNVIYIFVVILESVIYVIFIVYFNVCALYTMYCEVNSHHLYIYIYIYMCPPPPLEIEKQK